MPEQPKATRKSGGVFDSMHPYREETETNAALPRKGRERGEILRELGGFEAREDARWQTGQVSGSYYHGGKEHYAFLNQVFGLFSHVNLLQRDMCPSGTKFEGEIVSMVARMLSADAAKASDPGADVCGAITFGGSESIMLPMLAYREQAREEKGITAPQMVVPETIHPAFDKGAHYFGIELVHVPVGADHLADVDAMRARITKNTIAIAGSAGNYPHGLIDPLGRLSDLALERGIGFHVDGCLGGFLLPWIEKLGYDVPPFDFRLPGVTSMSCDTHKYGYGLKGTSVVLYRNRALRRRQYFSKTTWAGGLYASPTMAGSRSGGITAATWASMVSLGEEGYLESARRIMQAADTIQAGIARIPELQIFGRPTFCIAIRSDVVDIFHVNDFLATKGWRLNGLQLPPGVHLCVTLPQTLPGVAERFVADLAEGVAYAKNPPQPNARSGAVYGGGAITDRGVMRQMLFAWLDETYEL
jgi:glutamate/tyrosine decarboxylase-like PLP-dependent enzyme